MFNLFKSKPRQDEEDQQIKFTPTVQVNPNSQLFVECSPSDPNSASNIVINAYPSKNNRTFLKTRIQWARIKFINTPKHSIVQLPFIAGNVYQCQPADIGSYIRAKITSYDVIASGTAQATIGPIMLDPKIKSLVSGSLYSKSLKSQVVVLQKHEHFKVQMVLSNRTIHFTQQKSKEQLDMFYDMFEPRIELNPKDTTKIFLRFQKDELNRVRKWLDRIFKFNYKMEEQSFLKQQNHKSQMSNCSKNKIFKRCINKIEVKFLTRHCRDLFVFSLRAFICKETLKDEVIFHNIENVQELSNQIDVHRFFSFMSLKMEIYRLYNLVHDLENDRNQKVKDIADLENSITDMTLEYTKFIEEKGKLANVDFNQSYSEISIRREEILGRKQMKELQKQNQGLKLRIRELSEENQLKQFFRKENNQSMMFNQTANNPFAKKGDSVYHMSQQDINMPKGNILQLTKSYMALMKENEELKKNKKENPNASRDMINLLESLQQEDEDPNQLIKTLKEQNRILQNQVNELKSEVMKKNKAQSNIRLNQSIAMSQRQKSFNASMYSHNKEQSLLSQQSSMNQSLTSQANLVMLEQKIIQISQLNKRTIADNDRLRKQRDQFRKLYENVKKQKKSYNNIQDHSSSNLFDLQHFQKLKEQKEYLQNQNNSLKKKIQSILGESGKDELLQKKNNQLEKQLIKIKQRNQEIMQENAQYKQGLEKVKMMIGSEETINNENKLKKINAQLFQELNNVKKQLEKRKQPLYNSRVIQLETEVNFFKNQVNTSEYDSKATQKLLSEISKLQKENENLKRQISDKDSKLKSQAVLIQRLMNSHGDTSSILGKDKSYSETHNDSESNEKLKKKIRELQEQIVLMRRSSDALNRSRDISMDMYSFNEEQLEVLRKQKEMLLQQNQQVSRICQKYAKDARQGMKYKKLYLQLLKSQKQGQSFEKQQK